MSSPMLPLLLLPLAASAVPLLGLGGTASVGTGAGLNLNGLENIVDGLVCPLSEAVVDILRAEPEASAFCASVLHYPVSTVVRTTTVTPADVVRAVSTTVTETEPGLPLTVTVGTTGIAANTFIPASLTGLTTTETLTVPCSSGTPDASMASSLLASISSTPLASGSSLLSSLAAALTTASHTLPHGTISIGAQATESASLGLGIRDPALLGAGAGAGLNAGAVVVADPNGGIDVDATIAANADAGVAADVIASVLLAHLGVAAGAGAGVTATADVGADVHVRALATSSSISTPMPAPALLMSAGAGSSADDRDHDEGRWMGSPFHAHQKSARQLGVSAALSASLSASLSAIPTPSPLSGMSSSGLSSACACVGASSGTQTFTAVVTATAAARTVERTATVTDRVTGAARETVTVTLPTVSSVAVGTGVPAVDVVTKVDWACAPVAGYY